MVRFGLAHIAASDENVRAQIGASKLEDFFKIVSAWELFILPYIVLVIAKLLLSGFYDCFLMSRRSCVWPYSIWCSVNTVMSTLNCCQWWILVLLHHYYQNPNCRVYSGSSLNFKESGVNINGEPTYKYLEASFKFVKKKFCKL